LFSIRESKFIGELFLDKNENKLDSCTIGKGFWFNGVRTAENLRGGLSDRWRWDEFESV
jgi:hypothetical protein